MQLSLIKSGGLIALTLGAYLAVPMTAKCSILTISSAAPTATIGNAATSFTFSGISSTAAVPGSTINIGSFTLNASGTANGNVIDLRITPNVNGATAVLDFDGTVKSVGSAYYLDFSATPGTTAITVSNTSYTEKVFAGYDFGVQTDFNLPGGSPGKANSIFGFVQVAPATTPEPASFAITGLGLALAALATRKSSKSVFSN